MSRTKKPVIETHAKEETFAPTLLEQVWGSTDLSRYGTLNEPEYITQVESMTRADLETHARKMGVVVVENSLRLRDKLISEFRNYICQLQQKPAITKSNTKVSDAALKVLAEGR
jgi:hypothetical protein